MVPWRYLRTFVKGYELSGEKIASIFKFDCLKEPDTVLAYNTNIVKTVLADEAYEGIAICEKHGHKGTAIWVLVLDDDDDMEELRKRPLPELHPSLVRIMNVLEGPDVWEVVNF